MIKGVGIDIIEIDRIKAAVTKYGQDFLSRIYTPRELDYCRQLRAWRFPELAVRFAAKEAYAKARGTGLRNFGKASGLHWKDIEVVNDQLGKPWLFIKGKKSAKIQVSLSHSRVNAVAVVYVEK